MEKSPTIVEITKALVAFQGKVESVTRNKENKFFNSEYATLDEIIETIRKPLSESGLALAQFPNGKGQLITLLLHISGEFFQNTIELIPKETTAQGQGGVITYARRYSLSAMLGIATEKDDDGNEANGKKSTTTTIKNEVKDAGDLFGQIVEAVGKAKTQSVAMALADKVEKSDKLTISQKDALDKIISRKIDDLETKVEPIK